MVEDIVCVIQRDMQIPPRTRETDAQYKSRTVYSCLSHWLKAITQDKTIGLYEVVKGISKTHSYLRLSKILEEFTELYPEIKPWFYPDEKIDTIHIIRDCLLNSGEIIETSFSADIGLPEPICLQLNDDALYYSGLPAVYGNGFISGLAWILVDAKSGNQSQDISTLKYFEIPDIDASQYFLDYCTSVSWEKIDSIENYELFNPQLRSALSSCWIGRLEMKENVAYMARRQRAYVYEYRLVKKIKDQCYIHGFSDYLQETRETQRMLYGIRYIWHNAMSVRCSSDGDYVELNFYSKLPPKYENLLRFFSWPLENISNSFDFLLRKEAWNFIKVALKTLNIKIQEA